MSINLQAVYVEGRLVALHVVALSLPRSGYAKSAPIIVKTSEA